MVFKKTTSHKMYKNKIFNIHKKYNYLIGTYFH